MSVTWEDYINKEILKKYDFDRAKFIFDNEQLSFSIPAIIKATVILLEKFLNQGSKLNAFVMPENDQMVFLCAIIETIYSLQNGRIGMEYDIRNFANGTKAKVGKAIIEFRGLVNENGNIYGLVEGNKFRQKILLDRLPFLQKTDSEKKLSTANVYSTELKKAEQKNKLALDNDATWLMHLSDFKTHLNGSVYYVAPIIKTKEMMKSCIINGLHLDDILLLGQGNLEGQVVDLNHNQIHGIPAITLCGDLMSIVSCSENNPIESVIYNITNSEQINSQLSYLDEIISLNKPILCLCDTVNSADMSELEKRGFNIWRWNSNSLTVKLLGEHWININKRTRNCFNREVTYIDLQDEIISECITKILKHKEETIDAYVGFQLAFNKLSELTFTCLRNPSQMCLSNEYKEYMLSSLAETGKTIISEKAFIQPEAFTDLTEVIESLRILAERTTDTSKAVFIKNYIVDNSLKTVGIIIPDKMQLGINKYWDEWAKSQNNAVTVHVYKVSEFLSYRSVDDQMIFVPGWFNKTAMRKILYSNIAAKYTVLLYSCEAKWQRMGDYYLRRSFDDKNNNEIIKTLLKQEFTVNVVETNRTDNMISVTSDNNDEIEELNEIINNNRINKYSRSSKSESKSIRALPITFIGDYYSFYSEGHKIIRVTSVISDGKDTIETVFPDQLEEGDFVVLSENDKDLIKEVGDQILASDNNLDKIKMASKWRESIEVEKMFSTEKDIILKLKNSGIAKTNITLNNWLTDEEMIAPKNKEDIKKIAKALNDSVLLELADVVYDAAEIVRKARQSAGKQISNIIKENLVQELEKLGEIDVYNLWKPIEVVIPNIGKAIVLKIIDINKPIFVDSSNTNRLIKDKE